MKVHPDFAPCLPDFDGFEASRVGWLQNKDPQPRSG